MGEENLAHLLIQEGIVSALDPNAGLWTMPREQTSFIRAGQDEFSNAAE
jgi:hypothetical protein